MEYGIVFVYWWWMLVEDWFVYECRLYFFGSLNFRWKSVLCDVEINVRCGGGLLVLEEMLCVLEIRMWLWNNLWSLFLWYLIYLGCGGNGLVYVKDVCYMISIYCWIVDVFVCLWKDVRILYRNYYFVSDFS